jgi:hypothetical protein
MALVVRPIIGSVAVPLAPVCIRPETRGAESVTRPPIASASLEGDLAVQSILTTGKQLDIAMLPMGSKIPWSHAHQPALRLGP